MVSVTAVERPDLRRKKVRLHGKIARQLAIAIISGRYRAGELLICEEEACAELQVSRSSYREAIRTLAAKGLLSPKPKIGTRVNPKFHWQLLDPDVLAWTFEAPPDREQISRLFELRNIIEPSAAGLAATRRTDADLDIMKLALRNMKRFPLSTPQGRSADQEFHVTLLRASGNPYLSCLAAGIRAAVDRTEVKQRTGRLVRDPIRDHIDVFDAVAAGDPAGSLDAMRGLVNRALSDFIKAFSAG
ncbi:MAG: FadR family transcriptional regulator [Alphaproteobacteria bacterium]|nr:FadR family transcriptional regulator [Alphaproteobacteria bacterium]